MGAIVWKQEVSALAFSLGHADHHWFRNVDLSHVSTKIFKSNKIKNTKDKTPITFRIQCLDCCVFQNDVFSKSLRKRIMLNLELFKVPNST